MPPWDIFQDHPLPKQKECGPPQLPSCSDAHPFIQQTLRALCEVRVYTLSDLRSGFHVSWDQCSVHAGARAQCGLGPGLSVSWDVGSVCAGMWAQRELGPGLSVV